MLTKKSFPNRARLAFILCAGVGARLRPLTLRYPKALLPVGGRPMVFHVLDALRRHGVRRFIVNLHAQAAILRRHLTAYGKRHHVRFTFLHERRLLDTGGALRNAAHFLIEPFWLVNCDFFTPQFSFADMERAHRKRQSTATLAVRPMRPCETHNPVGVDRKGRLVRVTKVFGTGGQDHVFLGAHRLELEALACLAGEKIFPIFSGLYQNLFRAGIPIHTYAGPHLGIAALDLGTLEGYYSANLR